eukprot:jgi/Ulvmu1/7150/UM034_0057.1
MMHASGARLRLAGAPQRFRMPRRARLPTGACSALRLDEEVHVYGFNEQGEFALLTESEAWEAMATGEVPESSNGSAPTNGASNPVEEAEQWIAAWKSKQPREIVDAGAERGGRPQSAAEGDMQKAAMD